MAIISKINGIVKIEMELTNTTTITRINIGVTKIEIELKNM